MKYIIILAVIVGIVGAVIKKSIDNENQNKIVNSESNNHNEYFNKINSMSYEQLDKIHDDLLPLCNEISFIMLPNAYGDKVGTKSQEEINRMIKNKENEILPADKQIYGCKTYGDAQKLNQAIVKRLDYLYDNGGTGKSE